MRNKKTRLMKTLLVVIAVVLVAFTVTQAFVTKDVAKTEEQPYDFIWRNGKLEGRFYPKAVMATVIDSATNYKNSSNQNFNHQIEKKRAICNCLPL